MTQEQELKLLTVLEDAVNNYQESDKASRAKNAYDVLFKALAKRSHVSEKILLRQQKLAHVLVVRAVGVFKGYHSLLEEKKAS